MIRVRARIKAYLSLGGAVEPIVIVQAGQSIVRGAHRILYSVAHSRALLVPKLVHVAFSS